MFELNFLGHDLEIFTDEDGNMDGANLNDNMFSELLNDTYYEQLNDAVAKHCAAEEQKNEEILADNDTSDYYCRTFLK